MKRLKTNYLFAFLLLLGMTFVLSACNTQQVPSTPPLSIDTINEYESTLQMREKFAFMYYANELEGGESATDPLTLSMEEGVRQSKALAFEYGSIGLGLELATSEFEIDGVTNQHIYFSFWFKGDGKIEEVVVRLYFDDSTPETTVDVTDIGVHGGYIHIKITDFEAGRRADEINGFALGIRGSGDLETGTVYFDDIRFTEEVLLDPKPIVFDGGFFDKFFVYPVGMLLKFIADITGGLYALGIVLTTIIIRTLAWPIYAKTNDMSLKMQIMQPEQARLQEKYADRKDPESQKMMQMETMQLYKKYKVGLGGCLLPFLQMPIFLSIYNVIRRAPDTWTSNGTFATKVFGVDLFLGQTDTAQKIGIWILALLVVATQLFMQWLMMRRQKKLRDDAQSDVPDYRKKTSEQTQNIQKQTQMMMYFMTIMMAVFVLQSPAGLGFYWLIGNIYSAIQTYIGQRFSDKRMLKLIEKHK